VDRGDWFWLTPAGFTYCGICGCLIMEGMLDRHRNSCVMPNG